MDPPEKSSTQNKNIKEAIILGGII